MEIGKGLFIVIVILALFAGPGIIHVAQMVGILKIDIAVSPTQFVESEQVPSHRK